MTMTTGHIIRLVGLDNYDDLRGSGLYFFVGDEWADVPPEAWTEVVQPMLATAHGHTLKIGTPKGFDHFYDAYAAGQPGSMGGNGKLILDSRSWLYTTAQGGNVPPEELDRARRDLDPRTFEQEYEAGFVTYSGRVVYAFDRTKNVSPWEYKRDKQVYIGMDFNVNPMSATCWQTDENGIDHQFDEIMLPGSDTDKMSDEIMRRFGPNPTYITVIPDPAGSQHRTSAQGRTDISILRDRNFRVIAMAAHPKVRDRYNVFNARWCNAAGERRMFVDPRCKQSITAYERLVYKEDTNEPDKTSGYDHVCDSASYMTYGRYAYKPPTGVRVTFMDR